VRRAALVTGSTERMAAVTPALEQGGFEVIEIGDTERPEQVFGRLPKASFACYVQLPLKTEARGATVVDRIRNFLKQGLLARFELADRVLPLLANNATVVLVAGHQPSGRELPDDREARVALLRVLAQAILAETGDSGVAAVVVDHDRTPREIAAIAGRGRAQQPPDRATSFSAYSPELTWDQWRTEIMSLTSLET
jgi:hypothetical protein